MEKILLPCHACFLNDPKQYVIFKYNYKTTPNSILKYSQISMAKSLFTVCRPSGTCLRLGWSSWRTLFPPPCTSYGRCRGPGQGWSWSWPPGCPPPRPSSFSTPDSTTLRSGLGNILYCPHHKVGNHSTADLAPEEPRLHPDEKKALNEDHQLVSQRQLTTDQLCKSR